MSDQDRAEAIELARKDDDVKALVVRIDSPGGTFVGSDDLHRHLKAFAEDKPVVAVIGDVAASGGYMTALAAHRIYARRGSITASVGVVFQSPRVTRLMETVGVDVDVWRSGDLKALPSPVEESPEAARVQAQAMVDRLFALFLEMVREGRGLGADVVDVIDDGRVVIGAQALELGLIDALGDEASARTWLEDEKDVSKDLKTVDITPPPPIEPDGLLGKALGFLLGGAVAEAGGSMTGLLALWSPLAPGPALR